MILTCPVGSSTSGSTGPVMNSTASKGQWRYSGWASDATFWGFILLNYTLYFGVSTWTFYFFSPTLNTEGIWEAFCLSFNNIQYVISSSWCILGNVTLSDWSLPSGKWLKVTVGLWSKSLPSKPGSQNDRPRPNSGCRGTRRSLRLLSAGHQHVAPQVETICPGLLRTA